MGWFVERTTQLTARGRGAPEHRFGVGSRRPGIRGHAHCRLQVAPVVAQPLSYRIAAVLESCPLFAEAISSHLKLYVTMRGNAIAPRQAIIDSWWQMLSTSSSVVSPLSALFKPSCRRLVMPV